MNAQSVFNVFQPWQKYALGITFMSGVVKIVEYQMRLSQLFCIKFYHFPSMIEMWDNSAWNYYLQNFCPKMNVTLSQSAQSFRSIDKLFMIWSIVLGKCLIIIIVIYTDSIEKVFWNLYLISYCFDRQLLLLYSFSNLFALMMHENTTDLVYLLLKFAHQEVKNTIFCFVFFSFYEHHLDYNPQ